MKRRKLMNRRDLTKKVSLAAAGIALTPALAAAGKAKGPRLVVRRSHERGQVNHGWLKAKHSFSFGNYHDPRNMSFRSLRVINEDVIQPSRGFPMHPHNDMEILTYVLEGSIRHRDSLGNGGVIKPGEIQRMTAGTGIRHSEFNASSKKRLHLLQIWITPDRKNYRPGYAQRAFPTATRKNQLRPIATPNGAGTSVRINQNIVVYASLLDAKKRVAHVVKPKRHAWIQVARGAIRVNGVQLTAGDAVRTSDAGTLNIVGVSNAEFLVFDLA